MEKDSIPENEQSDLQDHSSNTDSADTTDESQSSNDESPQFFGNDENQEEEQGDHDDAQSQAQGEDNSTEEGDSSDEDKDLAKWASSQNLSLETETEIKLAKRLRDTQKSLHEKSAEAKQKFAEAESEDHGDDKVARIEARLARSDFFEANPEAKALEGAMFDHAVAVRDAGDIEGFKYFRTPAGWKTLYAIVKANQSSDQSEDSYNSGRKDERTNLAKKQQASTAKKGASDSKMTDGKVSDEQIDNMTAAEYSRFRQENPDWNPFG